MVAVKLLTQGIYDATFNFKDDTNGVCPSGWYCSNPYSSACHKVYEYWNGHKKILRIRDTQVLQDTWARPTFTHQSVGTVEFYIGADDTTYGFELGLRNNITRPVRYALDNGNHRHHDPFVNIQAAVDDTWYRIKIEFRCNGAAAHPDDGGLGQNEYNIYIAVGTADFGAASVSGAAFDFVVNSINRVWTLSMTNEQFLQYGYLDALGITGLADDYQVGDNQLLLIDEDISSDLIDAKITTEIGKIPKGMLRIKDNIFEEDAILILEDDATSWQLSKGLRKGSLNFRDEVIGALPTEVIETGDTWTDTSGAGCDVYVIDKYNKIARPLQFSDYNAATQAYLKYGFNTPKTSGTIEFLINKTTTTTRFSFYLFEGVDTRLLIYWEDDGNLKYWDGGPHVIETYNPHQWYRVSLEFDCSDDSFTLDIDGVEKQTGNFNGDASAIDDFRLITNTAGDDCLVLIAAIGVSWDSDYTLGDNANYEVTLADQTIFEGQIIKQTREAIRKYNLLPLTEELNQSVGEQGSEVTITADYTPQMINELINNYNHTSATEQSEKRRGTYIFLNGTNNIVPMGCLCYGNVTVATESIGGHQYTVEFDDNDAGSETMTIFFEDQDYGTVEFWYYCDDPTDQFFVQLKHGTTIVAGVGFDGDEFQYWKDDSTWANCTTIVTGPVASTWYRIKIDFECTADDYTGLSQYDYSITVYDASGNMINDVEDDINMDSNEAHIDNILFSTGAVDNGHLVYIDSIGLSWDWEYPICMDYVIGSNKQIIVDEIQASILDAASANVLLEGDVSGVKFLKDHTDRELMIWYLNFSKDVCVSDGSIDSMIDFSSTDNIWAVKGTDRIQRVNKVIVKGGQAGAARKYATADNTASQSIYGVKAIYVFVPEVTDETDDLQAIADGILAEHENAPDQVVLWRDCSDVGMMQVGETVTISASDIEYSKNSEYITAGQWIIKKIVYYPLTQVAKIWLIDSLIYEPDEKEIEFIEKIVNAGL